MFNRGTLYLTVYMRNGGIDSTVYILNGVYVIQLSPTLYQLSFNLMF